MVFRPPIPYRPPQQFSFVKTDFELALLAYIILLQNASLFAQISAQRIFARSFSGIYQDGITIFITFVLFVEH